mmetsp:Transcript_12693/g.20181  ORF Transcript_12693/g.20181 Transcript_12693/m.20181 type:complete len:200 (+) Transcript_12693:364-963(+)
MMEPRINVSVQIGPFLIFAAIVSIQLMLNQFHCHVLYGLRQTMDSQFANSASIHARQFEMHGAIIAEEIAIAHAVDNVHRFDLFVQCRARWNQHNVDQSNGMGAAEEYAFFLVGVRGQPATLEILEICVRDHFHDHSILKRDAFTHGHHERRRGRQYAVDILLRRVKEHFAWQILVHFLNLSVHENLAKNTYRLFQILC